MVAHRVGVEGRVEGPHPALPVDEGAGLLRRRGHGQDHVGDLGHRRPAHLERDDEGLGQGLLDRGQGEVARLDAADHEGPDRPAAGGLDDRGGVAAGAVGQPDRVPDLGHLGSRRRVAHRAPTGQERRRGRRTRALRAPPAGGGPRRAGPRCGRRGPRRPRGRRAPWPGARRRGRRPRRRGRPRRPDPPGCRRGPRGPRPPGRGRSARADPTACAAPGWRTAPPRSRSLPERRTALRSRRKTIGDSSSGSKPTRSTDEARSRSA